MSQLRPSNAEKTYQREILLNRVVVYFGYVLVTCFAIILVMIFSGDRFRGTLNALGIGQFLADEEGLYADCSRPENRNNRFCGGNSHRIERDWNDVRSAKGGKHVPFQLSE